jgi:hypothetical protein
MRYLVIDLTMPKPHEKYTWSPRIENATSFPTEESADRCKADIPDARGVMASGDKWYVLKKS